MFDNFCLFLNLHYFKRDSYIVRRLSSPHFRYLIPEGLEGKAKVSAAVTHLALLGVRRQRAAFWVLCRRKGQSLRAALLRYMFYHDTN